MTYAEPKTLFVIPARGGSKGIPDKNIRHFNGVPLICRAVDQARLFAADADICVSTDSERIADTVRRYGLEVPFMRPGALATDGAGTYPVLLHAVDWYARQGRHYDRMVLLQTTSPLRRPEDIRAAIQAWTPDCDMAVTVCEAATNPYYNAFETDAEGFLHISKGPGDYTRRQDAPKVWEYNGAVYVISIPSLLREPLSAFARRLPVVMPRERSVDLDTPLDWTIAEALDRQFNDTPQSE